ncbi:hypothetical protein GNI_062980 [Gregarina niphandrodes]|uniref:Uncharacterized protein n=1 Tax=Gregarina niphandrodes TaxID=110365 RepID=A0A023B845_GRENI|nr:hypothetical protein GNI_062980 [Gregarina niphandrodes]EZG68276.1 hypothetical protein GNI_062980 [Gregarina niphandrodes]|eukprot:XP_011130017.1 hypothetical protein GNI_062980 [Gregarina niphandrodes]
MCVDRLIGGWGNVEARLNRAAYVGNDVWCQVQRYGMDRGASLIGTYDGAALIIGRIGVEDSASLEERLRVRDQVGPLSESEWSQQREVLPYFKLDSLAVLINEENGHKEIILNLIYMLTNEFVRYCALKNYDHLIPVEARQVLREKSLYDKEDIDQRIETRRLLKEIRLVQCEGRRC